MTIINSTVTQTSTIVQEVQGPPGIGVTTAAIDNTGNLNLALSNGTTIAAGSVTKANDEAVAAAEARLKEQADSNLIIMATAHIDLLASLVNRFGFK